jgi:predicted nucleic acid-binding protein
VSCVLDASSTVAYLLGDGTENEHAAMVGEAYAPALLDVEVVQTLHGLLRGDKIDLDVAEQAREELGELALRRIPDAALMARAWELRDVCSVYDGLYVALAEGMDVALVTRDAKLARGAGDLVEVITPGGG